MAFYPSIQMLSAGTISFVTGTQIATDWETANPAGSLPSGDVAVTKTDIATGNVLFTQDIDAYSNQPITNPLCIDLFGNIVTGNHGASNATGLLTYKYSDASFVANWGGNLSYPDGVANFVDIAATWAGAGAGLQSFVVGAGGIFLNGIWVAAAYPVLKFIGYLFAVDEVGNGTRRVCSGPATANMGSCYVVAFQNAGPQLGIYQVFISNGAEGYNPAIWPIPNGAISTVAFPKIMASDLGGGATTIACKGVVMDQTDGNLLMALTTDVAQYIVKYSPLAQRILWKNIVNTTPGNNNGNMMKFSSIKHGQYSILDFPPGTARCYSMDTISGEMTSYTNGLGGVDVFPLTGSQQAFNDTTGQILFDAHTSNVGGGPTLLNGTPSSFTNWAILNVAPVYSGNSGVAPYARSSYNRVWGDY